MKKILSLILVVILVFSMVACGKTPSQEKPTIEPEKEDVVEQATKAPTENVEVDVPDDEDVEESDPIDLENLPTPSIESGADKTAIHAFIVDKAYGETGDNVMFSPLSFDMAIGMAAEGAGSEYYTVFEKLLGTSNYSDFSSKYIEKAKSMNDGNDDSGMLSNYKMVFEIANSVWFDQKYDVKEKFANNMNLFDATVSGIDFQDRTGAASKINEWCKEKTRDMIDKVVQEESFSDDTAAVIVNALYFESPWKTPWDVVKEECEFESITAGKKNVDMIETSGKTYFENDNAIAFSSSYKNGLEFIGILPKNEGDFLVGDLDIESLIASRTNEYDVYAKMPKLKFDNKIDNLKKSLTEAGYGILFDGDQGMFTQMLSEGDKDAQLSIDDIIQIDSIELDENGTKAAAVTAAVMANGTSLTNPRETKEVILDRAFAFVIYDKDMDQIVFMGKVIDP